MLVTFVKYAGCGNDFILFDNRFSSLSSYITKNIVTKLCHRKFGIGADGIILLEDSKTADFGMRIYNADGSEAEMCGNGVRCLALYIRELTDQTHFTIETMQDQVFASIKDEAITVSMPLPCDFAYHLTLPIQLKSWTVHYLNTGVPHAVIFVDDLEDETYMELAPKIRHHPRFSPKGTNVNFAKILSANEIAVRTYERGVEQETLACGTGAVATALSAAHLHHLNSPIKIYTRSNDHLEIDFSEKHVTMTGPALKIFAGSVHL